MKKDSAVKWLENQIKTSKYFYKLMEDINSRSTVVQSNIFEQAKEMENKQIIDAREDGIKNGYGDYVDTEWGRDTEIMKTSEQYYNETFKSK